MECAFEAYADAESSDQSAHPQSDLVPCCPLTKPLDNAENINVEQGSEGRVSLVGLYDIYSFICLFIYLNCYFFSQHYGCCKRKIFLVIKNVFTISNRDQADLAERQPGTHPNRTESFSSVQIFNATRQMSHIEAASENPD